MTVWVGGSSTVSESKETNGFLVIVHVLNAIDNVFGEKIAYLCWLWFSNFRPALFGNSIISFQMYVLLTCSTANAMFPLTFQNVSIFDLNINAQKSSSLPPAFTILAVVSTN